MSILAFANLVRRHLVFGTVLSYMASIDESDRQLVASLESPLIYNELHERIAFAIRSIIYWNCSDRNLRRGSDRDARAQADLR